MFLLILLRVSGHGWALAHHGWRVALNFSQMLGMLGWGQPKA
jgi:hypothetical protein